MMLILLSFFWSLACSDNRASPQPRSTPGIVRVETVASGLVHPWALEFLPDGRMLVTERPGRLRIVSMNGEVSEPLSGTPAVASVRLAGLLDVALDPDFETNRLVYLSFVFPEEGGTDATAVMRGRFVEHGLVDTVVIYHQRPRTDPRVQYGSRMLFADDGTLFITQGAHDNIQLRIGAQELDDGMGKIVRINTDGSIPADNPFVGQKGALSEIWSYGHRNVQGVARHPSTGQLWTVEHGARGGDELNHPEAGRNYGWPVISYGRDYSGAAIGDGTAKKGMEQPVYYWDPVIAPSSIMFYTGNAMPGWNGDILIGSMLPGALVRLVLKGGEVVNEMRYLGELHERIREVKQGPDGLIYLLTDNENGRVLRVLPEDL